MRIVFHIDMDAFFAAVEERERPELKGNPVVVGADPKGGKGRGVVSTCSYEARKYGIRSGMPISIAYRLCPSAVFLPVNFPLYWSASDRVMTVLRKHAEKFQLAGIDEAFIEPKNVRTYTQAEALARKLKKEIKDKEHLTCSVGIAPNKLVAKIASDFNKPDGLTVVRPEEVRDFLAPLDVRKLYGVGPKTEQALKSMGMKTIGDIRKQDPGKLAEIFGKWGSVMHLYAQGEDDSAVEEREGPKSIGREVTFEEDTADFSMINSVLNEISEDIYNTAKNAGYDFRTVVLKIRFTGFETHTKQKKAGDKSADGIKRTAEDLLLNFANSKKKVRLIGLRLTNLSKI